MALTTSGGCLSPTTWQTVMQNIILYLLQKVSSNYFNNATITPEVPVLEVPNFGGK